MKIEIISIPDCPHHRPTVERVRSVMINASVCAELIERIVSNEAEGRMIGFAGSPTVLIDGADLEQVTNPSANLACRIYADGSGVPSGELIRAAGIERASRERSLKSEDADTLY